MSSPQWTMAAGVEPAIGWRSRVPARRVVAWVFPLCLAALGIAAVNQVGISVAGLADGVVSAGELLARSWPPTLAEPATTAKHVLDTVWMAVAGTALAAAVAAVLGVLAARTTTPARPVRSAALAVIVACRAIPDVVFAVFFVAALGIGPLPGVLALGLHSIGMLGKLFAEAMERADDGVRDAVATTGAGPLQRLAAGVLPQVAPAYIAAVLYRLDINFRGSVLLGAVGAGGIGLDLKTAFGFTDYQEATGIALVTVAVVLLVEGVSAALRAFLIAPGTARADGIPPVRGCARQKELPWQPIQLAKRELRRSLAAFRREAETNQFMIAAAVLYARSTVANGIIHSVQRMHQALIRAGLARGVADMVGCIEDFTCTPLTELPR